MKKKAANPAAINTSAARTKRLVNMLDEYMKNDMGIELVPKIR
jgi:hypothetical protein